MPSMLRFACKVVMAAMLLCFLPTAAPAENPSGIAEVVSTSPSWDTFTNEDGTGLYHEILREVFALYGVEVRHLYSKSGRSEELVAENVADMMTCDDKATPPLVLGRYPLYVNSYYVFFKKDRIGPWKGIETLRDKEVLSQHTYYSQENFSVPVHVKDVQSGEQALAMILLDRSDFYVDDMTLIKQSMRLNTTPYDENDFDLREVGKRSYHPLFNQTERGQAIMEMYDEGMLKLHKAGKLKPIYDKWGYQYPDFDDY